MTIASASLGQGCDVPRARERERQGGRDRKILEFLKQATTLNKPLMNAVTVMRRAVNLMKAVTLNKQQSDLCIPPADR